MDAFLIFTKPTNIDLAGFKIYWGYSPGVYPNVITLTNPQAGGSSIGSWLLQGLPDGRRIYFAVSAIDGTPNESAKSNEVSKINPYTIFRL